MSEDIRQTAPLARLGGEPLERAAAQRGSVPTPEEPLPPPDLAPADPALVASSDEPSEEPPDGPGWWVVLRDLLHRLGLMLAGVQNFIFFSGRVIGLAFSRPFYARDLYEQLHFNGVGSIHLVVFSTFFAGQGMAIQFVRELKTMGTEVYLGKLMVVAIVRALGPTLTGLVVAARTSSGITAELGAMKSSNQIDALTAFGTDPLRKLAVPRMLSMLIMLPCLTLIADLSSLFGGAIVSVGVAHVSSVVYWSMVRNYLTLANLGVGMVKPVAYSFIISLVACYQGFTTRGGTKGVGQSTTNSVVIASVSILVADFVLTRVVFSILGW